MSGKLVIKSTGGEGGPLKERQDFGGDGNVLHLGCGIGCWGLYENPAVSLARRSKQGWFSIALDMER